MNNKKNIILEEYENEFSYKKSKTNLDIQFNRIAFIFFVFLMIAIIYSIQLLYLGSLKPENNKKSLIINKNHSMTRAPAIGAPTSAISLKTSTRRSH